MKRTCLGLDISSQSTGFATVSNGRWIRANGLYGLIKPTSTAGLGEKLSQFKKELEDVLDKTNPDVVVIEDIFSSRNIKTVKILARFSGVAIETVYAKLKKEPLIITTTSVRAFLKSGQKKEQAFDFIKKKYKLDWDFKTHNDITDAIALSLYGYKNFK